MRHNRLVNHGQLVAISQSQSVCQLATGSQLVTVTQSVTNHSATISQSQSTSNSQSQLASHGQSVSHVQKVRQSVSQQITGLQSIGLSALVSRLHSDRQSVSVSRGINFSQSSQLQIVIVSQTQSVSDNQSQFSVLVSHPQSTTLSNNHLVRFRSVKATDQGFHENVLYISFIFLLLR